MKGKRIKFWLSYFFCFSENLSFNYVVSYLIFSTLHKTVLKGNFSIKISVLFDLDIKKFDIFDSLYCTKKSRCGSFHFYGLTAQFFFID